MKPSSKIIMPEQAHHDHAHRRAILVAVIIIGLIILTAIAYQFFANYKSADENFRDTYTQERINQNMLFTDQVLLRSDVTPLTQEEIEKAQAFYQQNDSQRLSEEAYLEASQTNAGISEDNYQQWKASQAK